MAAAVFLVVAVRRRLPPERMRAAESKVSSREPLTLAPMSANTGVLSCRWCALMQMVCSHGDTGVPSDTGALACLQALVRIRARESEREKKVLLTIKKGERRELQLMFSPSTGGQRIFKQKMF